MIIVPQQGPTGGTPNLDNKQYLTIHPDLIESLTI